MSKTKYYLDLIWTEDPYPASSCNQKTAKKRNDLSPIINQKPSNDLSHTINHQPSNAILYKLPSPTTNQLLLTNPLTSTASMM